MKFGNFDIDCDIVATQKYRDYYNEKCECEECGNFRKNFNIYYPKIVEILSWFGIHIMYPLEIMDLGIDRDKNKREYSVYYSVKGKLPIDRIEHIDDEVSFILRNWNIASESYSNTGMIAPYFIVEVLNIFLPY
ncbi:hypothetical protein KQI88_10470 [Alkaliphilus sp. MSJ-5]|uniref:Uncharacterized protein n=1 Tax=Alkaliphilus flagellatus TaxID=2841507 RepID=A0ABS6G2Y8_9FIRM|nr:hypothetical protein [Alkaliphilus flagellatus]MBU5676842.1 hypothetical protein [Alkaliphilus flagellatus]